MASCCKDLEIRKSEFVTKTKFFFTFLNMTKTHLYGLFSPIMIKRKESVSKMCKFLRFFQTSNMAMKVKFYLSIKTLPRCIICIRNQLLFPPPSNN